MSEMAGQGFPDCGVRAGMEFCRGVLLCAFFLCASINIFAQQPKRTREPAPAQKSNAAMASGRQDFETRCASCHGLDGRGGEHAPNISTDPAVRNPSDRDIFKMVHDGIPAKGMPAFGNLPDAQIKSMVSYLRSLSGSSGWEFVSGNSPQGEAIFFGKGGCGQCHMMRGKGGFLGADLTDYAATHAPIEAKDGILNPGKLRDGRQEMAAIVTREGERLSGVVRNEDNFSLQLLGEDGTFHMLLKSDIDHMERSDNAIMPADFGQRLTQSELDDLMSFLAQHARRTERPLKKPVD